MRGSNILDHLRVLAHGLADGDDLLTTNVGNDGKKDDRQATARSAGVTTTRQIDRPNALDRSVITGFSCLASTCERDRHAAHPTPR